MSNVQVIVCSHLPLPYDRIGSWTTMYEHLFNGDHEIDYILCPQPENPYQEIKYLSPSLGLSYKLKRKLKLGKKFDPYFKALKSHLSSNDSQMIIQVVDNAGFAFELHKYLKKNKCRERCYIQFYYHGFLPFYDGATAIPFLKGIDQYIYITHASKKYHLESYPTYNSKSSVLHNGIDRNKFLPVSQELSHETRDTYGISKSACVYLWLSQDRKKKGLDFLLSFWEAYLEEHPDSLLVIVGTNRKVDQKSTMVLGRIPNHKLPAIYQMTDVYLFPTLWQEGFGLSLVEALSCGCYCIASQIGGVPEVLDNGRYGVLVKDPFDQKEWIAQMNKAYQLKQAKQLKNTFQLPKNTYSLEVWKKEMNILLKETKKQITSCSKGDHIIN